jgi:Ran-binding protein 1
MRLLKHKTSGLVRVLVRAEKTHKCLMNHYIIAKDIFCQLEALKTSNNSWTWAAHDISDEKPETEKFCAKFTSKDDFARFEVEFKKAIEINKSILDKKEETKPAEEKPAEEKPAEKVEEKKE